MSEYNKTFSYLDYNFNFCVTFDNDSTEESPHTLVVNDLGQTNYRASYNFNNDNMFDTIAMAKDMAIEWSDKRSGKNKQELLLIQAGFTAK